MNLSITGHTGYPLYKIQLDTRSRRFHTIDGYPLLSPGIYSKRDTLRHNTETKHRKPILLPNSLSRWDLPVFHSIHRIRLYFLAPRY